MRDGKFLICTLIPNTDGIKSDRNSQARVKKKKVVFPHYYLLIFQQVNLLKIRDL